MYGEQAGNADKFYSDDKKYSLEVSYYKNGILEDHIWNSSRGLVRNEEVGKLLFDIRRGYPAFWHLFVNHLNGNSYLLCGRDYHGGYNILDLTNQIDNEYKPDHSNNKQYFCWTSAEFNKTLQQLEVVGCYWGDIFEKVIFDFSNPSNIPLPEISRSEILNSWEDKDK